MDPTFTASKLQEIDKLTVSFVLDIFWDGISEKVALEADGHKHGTPRPKQTRTSTKKFDADADDFMMSLVDRADIHGIDRSTVTLDGELEVKRGMVEWELSEFKKYAERMDMKETLDVVGTDKYKKMKEKKMDISDKL